MTRLGIRNVWRAGGDRLGRALEVLRGRSPAVETQPPARADVLAALNRLTQGADFQIVSAQGVSWLEFADGLRFRYVDAYNSISQLMIITGHFEERELALVVGNVPNRGVFLDVGANAGLYTLRVALGCPSATIHAFEPVPQVADMFLENVVANGLDQRRIHLNRAAVSDREGLARMTLDWHSSNYITTCESECSTIEVPMLTLDGYAEEVGLDRVDVIKIDVEGHELHVLQGARALLARFRPLVLAELMERPEPFGDRRADDYSAVLEFMRGLGYRWHVVDDEGTVVAGNEMGSFVGSYHNYFFHHVEMAVPLL